MDASETDTHAEINLNGINPHPTREDLRIQVHEDERGGTYWGSLAEAQRSIGPEGGAYASIVLFTGRQEYRSARDAYNAAADLAPQLDAICDAAREAMR